MSQDAEKNAAKHLWKMELGLHVYGQGEGMDAALIRLPDGLADASDAVTSFVTVEIGRLAGNGLGRQVVSAGLLSYAPYGVDRLEQEDKGKPEGADQKECPRRRLRQSGITPANDKESKFSQVGDVSGQGPLAIGRKMAIVFGLFCELAQKLQQIQPSAVSVACPVIPHRHGQQLVVTRINLRLDQADLRLVRCRLV